MAKTSKKHTYPSDLTDAQWQKIEPLFSNTRTYKWSKREGSSLNQVGKAKFNFAPRR